MTPFVPADLLMLFAQFFFWGTFIRRGMAARAGMPVAVRAGSGPRASRPAAARHPSLGGWIATAGFIILGVGFFSGKPGSLIGKTAALTLTLLGVTISVWSLAVFRSWRLAAEIDEGHELVTEGPFRFVRHPIYLALTLNAIALFLWRPSIVSVLGVFVVYLSGEMRGRAEEHVLIQGFGNAYSEYMARTKRFLPFVY